jgi:hypothetical protein
MKFQCEIVVEFDAADQSTAAEVAMKLHSVVSRSKEDTLPWHAKVAMQLRTENKPLLNILGYGK